MPGGGIIIIDDLIKVFPEGSEPRAQLELIKAQGPLTWWSRQKIKRIINKHLQG